MTNINPHPETISQEYKEQLELLHSQNEDWGTSSLRHLPRIEAMLIERSFASFLEIGCGKGKLVEALKEKFPDRKIEGYDPAVPAYAPPKPAATITACIDVLEHIEPEYLDNFLKLLARKTHTMCYMVIALTKAKQILPDGRNAHLIIENSRWWKMKVIKHFRNVIVVGETVGELRLIGYK